MTNPGCDKIVAYSEENYIHIGWTEGGHSHYIRFQTSPIQWSYYRNVTENEYGGGNNPDLTISANKIHYTYLASGYWAKSRDKIKESTSWQNSMEIPFTDSSIQYHKPVLANNKVNAAFRVYYSTFEISGAYISNSDRPLDQGFWNENVYLRESEIGYETEVESTVDNKIHFIYYDKYDNKWEHRYLSGSTLSGQIGEISLVAYPSSTLIANSNDLYLLALWSTSTPTWIKLQRYDMAPAAPKNLTITKSANNHPLLSWTSNKEPDLNIHKIYRLNYCAGGWECIAQTSNTSYEDQTLSYCTAIPPEQCINLCTFQYKVTAVDLSYHESDPSNIVEARLVGGPPSKAGAGDPDVEAVYEYLLGQNYPNPFNPSTWIDYTIKSTGLVALKVYDMLGTEVASLVNEVKEAGSYSVTLNAGNLPSEIYFYTLTSGNFMSTKKLILLK